MKTIAITGATGAVAGSAAEMLAAAGVNLILIGRDNAKLKTLRDRLSLISKTGDINCIEADLSDTGSVKKAVKKLSAYCHVIDTLINSAAVFNKERIITPEGRELMFASNHLGPFVLTLGIRHLLEKAEEGRVITLSAPSAVRLDLNDLGADKKFSALSRFGGTKMANLLFAFKLAREFAGSSVSSCVFFPGLVRSKLMHQAPAALRMLIDLFSSPPAVAGSALAALALGGKVRDVNGKFFTKKLKAVRAPASSYDISAQDKLWQVSLELTGKNEKEV